MKGNTRAEPKVRQLDNNLKGLILGILRVVLNPGFPETPLICNINLKIGQVGRPGNINQNKEI